MNEGQREQLQRRAIIVLEDNEAVSDGWRSRMMQTIPDVHISTAATREEAWKGVEHCEQELHERVALAIVDMVIDTSPEEGILFLRDLKIRRPEIRRMMFTGQATHEQVQCLLDEGLVHDFESKGSFASDGDIPEAVLDKIRGLVHGHQCGNVCEPDPVERFEQRLRCWIQTLPDGEDTLMRNLSGRTMKARDIFKSRSFVERLRQADMVSALDSLVLHARKEEDTEETDDDEPDDPSRRR